MFGNLFAVKEERERETLLVRLPFLIGK